MNTQSQATANKENQLTLELLEAIDSKDDISQRHLAQEMGVALGLANSYLKRCVKKGWIKITTAPANRYLYYLTPNGFAEKARLTSEFLSTSLALFRQSGDDYDEAFSNCLANGQKRILFAGLSDLTEIAYLRSLQSDIEVVAVYQSDEARSLFFDIPIIDNPALCPGFDQIVMTSMEQTHDLVELLSKCYGEERIIVPSLLLNMQYRSDNAEDEINSKFDV
ncbi:MAG: winged helix-turn-helix transcriptional regulator [Acidiferrobacterales bacterium]|nr:winged helix-turn-helix transcriptional regulator [Acidiferrobacterales bacterium]